MTSQFIPAALIAAALISAPAFAADQPIVGAPSPVPHPVAAYLPITIAQNKCLVCHREQPEGAARRKGEIPRSHYAAPGQLAGERCECMLCHAESSDAKPLAPVDANEAAH